MKTAKCKMCGATIACHREDVLTSVGPRKTISGRSEEGGSSLATAHAAARAIMRRLDRILRRGIDA